MMREQIYARALLMAGDLDGHQQELLRVLCAANASAMEARMRDTLTAEDCREEFVTAVSLYALADMEGFEEVTEFKAGDLTVKTGERNWEQSAGTLRRQAEALMAPYLKDRFTFVGV